MLIGKTEIFMILLYLNKPKYVKIKHNQMGIIIFYNKGNQIFCHCSVCSKPT